MSKMKLGKIGCFDVDNPPDGVWGIFAPELKVQVRKLTSEVIKGIRQKHITTSMEVDSKSRSMVPVERIDDDKYEDALTDYIIQDFTDNFVDDETGEPLPKHLESKKRMLNYLPLKEWVWAFAQAMDTTENDLKNLGKP